jgi:hypothetical protein
VPARLAVRTSEARRTRATTQASRSGRLSSTTPWPAHTECRSHTAIATRCCGHNLWNATRRWSRAAHAQSVSVPFPSLWHARPPDSVNVRGPLHGRPGIIDSVQAGVEIRRVQSSCALLDSRHAREILCQAILTTPGHDRIDLAPPDRQRTLITSPPPHPSVTRTGEHLYG